MNAVCSSEVFLISILMTPDERPRDDNISGLTDQQFKISRWGSAN